MSFRDPTIQPVSDDLVVGFADDLAGASFAIPLSEGYACFGVPSSWSDPDRGVIEKWSLVAWASQASDMSNGRVLGGYTRSATIASDDIDTVDFADDELDITSHAYKHGDGPLQLTTTDTLPTGLSESTNYWVIVVGSGTIKLATSLEDALNHSAVSFSDGGTGTHTLEGTSDTKRIRWASHGLLGDAGDGSHSLSEDVGFRNMIQHDPNVVGYAVEGTFTADGISMGAIPVLVR